MGFIHRDIKPDNLMICQSGAVKVADLGLAKPSGSGQMSMLSGTNLVMGTPQYMPPEQWENTATVTTAADVWALGATLYYLLVGGEAIAKDSLPRIMQRIAAPMVGGLITSFFLELTVYPAIFAAWKGRTLGQGGAA